MHVSEAAELLHALEDVEIAEEALLKSYCQSLRECQQAIADAIMKNHAGSCDHSDCRYMVKLTDFVPYGEEMAKKLSQECTCQNGLECVHYTDIV